MTETILVALCLAGAGLISGLTGFGFALVAAGTLLSFKPPVEATALVLICSILSQTLSIVRLRTKPPLGATLAMTGAGLIGTPLGVYLLHDLSADMVKACVGCFLVSYSAIVACLRRDYKVRFGSMWSDGTVGFFGGVLGGIAGLSGALPTAWSLVRGWEPRIQRAVYQTFTLVIQIWSLAVLTYFDPLPRALIGDLSLALPIVLVSVLVGLSLFARIDQARFRTLVLILLAVIGVVTTGLALKAFYLRT
jgi:uncharacterized membrane protein YfcA